MFFLLVKTKQTNIYNTLTNYIESEYLVEWIIANLQGNFSLLNFFEKFLLESALVKVLTLLKLFWGGGGLEYPPKAFLYFCWFSLNPGSMQEVSWTVFPPLCALLWESDCLSWVGLVSGQDIDPGLICSNFLFHISDLFW